MSARPAIRGDAEIGHRSTGPPDPPGKDVALASIVALTVLVALTPVQHHLE